MESLTETIEGLDTPLNEAPDHAQKAKSAKPQDRVTLGRTETDKVDGWLLQINSSSKGFLELSRSDIVNFLIRTHKPEFLAKELGQIRADHYDPIKHIAWIAPQIKNAISKGDDARVAELQTELQSVSLMKQKIESSLSGPVGPKRPRATRKDGASPQIESAKLRSNDEISPG